MTDPVPTFTQTDGRTEAQPARELPLAAWIGIACAAFVVGLLIGALLLGKAFGGAGGFNAPTVASESQLEAPVASYSYGGKTVTVTLREVLESRGDVDSAKDEEGNYRLPSADTVLGYVRNQVLVNEATAQGITVSEDDLASYALDALGTADYSTLAQSYSMPEESVKASLETSAIIDKLHKTVEDPDNSTAETEISWSNYMNEVYAKATISIYELVS